MKKIISLLLVFVLACTALVSCGEQPGPAETTADPNKTPNSSVIVLDPNLPVDEGFGLDGKTPTDVSLFKYEELADGTIRIKSCKTDSVNELTEVVVPAVIDGKKVSTIGESTFANCSNVETFVIGGYVTEIEAYAFRDCTSMTSIKFPEYCAELGAGVFSGCTKLDKVDFLTMALTKVGERAFENCTLLNSVVIPDSVTSLGIYLFSGCSRLKEVTLSANITEIPERCFFSCKELANTHGAETLIIPEGVTSIGQYAFFECQAMKNVTIPSTVTKIGKNAFDTCRRLDSITVPDACTSIGNNAFNTCQMLKTVTMPAGKETKLGTDIFKDSKKIETINVTAGSAAETYCNEWKATIEAGKEGAYKSYTVPTINVTPAATAE